MGTDLTIEDGWGLPVTAVPGTKASCAALVSRQRLTTTELASLRTIVTDGFVPASDEWVRGRIVTLLSHYYISDKPEPLDRALADDWIEAIASSPNGALPEWALQRACVRWLSGPNARKRPLPGDILALVAEEMAWLYQAKSRLFLADHPHTRDWHPLARSWEPEEPTGPFVPREKLAKLMSDLASSLGSAKAA